jgi:hypothetical protein
MTTTVHLEVRTDGTARAALHIGGELSQEITGRLCLALPHLAGKCGWGWAVFDERATDGGCMSVEVWAQ